MKNIRVANINVKYKALFTYWLNITKPFHNLTPQQINVLSLFLYKYYEFKWGVKDEELIWSLLFNYDTKQWIRDELNMENMSFQNVMTQLRKKGAIKNKKISPTFIPIIEKDTKIFRIIYNFNISYA